MDTRSGGKQVAARITSIVAVGSFAVAGLGFVALDKAPASDASTTSSGYSESDDSPSSLDAEGDAFPRTPDSSSNIPRSPETLKSTVQQKTKSSIPPVTPGNGGSVSAKSSGS